MKKRFWKKVILILSIFFLYKVTSCSIMKYPEPNYYRFFRYNGPVSEAELEEFLPVWADFKQRYADNVGISESSLSPKMASEVVPFGMKIWLRSRKWDVDRFFFVEQRIYDVVNYIYMRRHAKEVVDVMESAYEREYDYNRRENIRNIIEDQKKFMNDKRANHPETIAVEKHLNEIVGILEN